MYIYGFISSSDDISLHCNPPTGNLSAINNNPLAVETFPPLIQAVYRGGLRDVKKKLKAGSDLHQTTPHGLSALHVAIQLHHHAIFDYLIQCQANIDQTAQPSYFSPLFVAVKVQNKHAYRKLMELGARDLPTSLHHTALFAAVYNNDLPAVQELLARGSDPYQYAITLICTLVYTAARYRHLEMLKFLLAYGLDPDDVGGDFSERYFFNLWENPEVPSTALSVAVSYCDQEMVELLLEAGADPNRKSGGAPPLHRAMANGLFPPSETINYYEIIERAHAIIDLLLQHGADIDLKSDDGYTFLTKAVKSGPIETVIHLIESGATINIPDNQGKFPIDHAKERGEKIIVNYLQQERSLL